MTHYINVHDSQNLSLVRGQDSERPMSYVGFRPSASWTRVGSVQLKSDSSASGCLLKSPPPVPPFRGKGGMRPLMRAPSVQGVSTNYARSYRLHKEEAERPATQAGNEISREIGHPEDQKKDYYVNLQNYDKESGLLDDTDRHNCGGFLAGGQAPPEDDDIYTFFFFLFEQAGGTR